jgi:hypothetical protein
MDPDKTHLFRFSTDPLLQIIVEFIVDQMVYIQLLVFQKLDQGWYMFLCDFVEIIDNRDNMLQSKQCTLSAVIEVAQVLDLLYR